MERKTIKIGEFEYLVEQFGAVQGMAIFARLAKLAGAAVAKTARSGGNEEAIIGAALSALDGDELVALALEFAKKTKLVRGIKNSSGATLGAPVDLVPLFDSHFAGRYFDMVEWLAFAVGLNFGNFIVDARQRGPGLRSMMASQFPALFAAGGGSSASSPQGGAE